MGYKTFEDMKHNIPEGATHYQDETLCFNFSWFNMNTGMRYFGGQWHPYSLDGYPMEIIKPIPFEIETPEEKEALDMIDTTSKQVESLANDSELPNSSEWKSGDECIYQGETYTYQCVASWDSDACILSGKSRNSHSLTDAWIDELSKPESKEQKAERERLELVKSACLTVRHDYGLMSESDRNFLEKHGLEWLKAFEKEGYMKEQK